MTATATAGFRMPGAGRLMFLLAAIFAFSTTTDATADVRQFLGRLLVDVRVELDGVPFADPSILQLIETRVGEPLSMERVRESIDHLVGLGRFEDIRVFAEASTTRPDGVTVRWTLVPVQRISRIDLTGDTALPPDPVREQIAERFGPTPATSRVPEVVQLLTGYYTERGYRQARVEAGVVTDRAAELVTLRVAITAGPRTTIGQVVVRGGGEALDALIGELRLERGRAFDGPAIDARVSALENRLRDLGFYEANVDVTPTFVVGAPVVDLLVDVERGPRVRVVFAGDPLPENRRDALVSIRAERSVALDLLEDASRNIQAFLRQQGYRSAEAPYVREMQADQMILTFTVTRGPLHRLATMDVTGSAAMARGDILPLLVLQPGEPFADGRVATVAAAVTELYRVRGFAGVVVKPDVSVLPAQSADGQEVRQVTVRLVVTEGPQTTVGDVTIAGADALTGERVQPLLSLTSGKPFYRPHLEADRDAIARLYQNEGFQSVRVGAETSLHEDGHRLALRWTIREGARTFVDRVLVSGNVRVGADLIRQEVVLKPGSPLGAEAVVESQRRLATLGLFRRVRIAELPHGSSITRDILIDVEEAPPTTLSYGGGLEAGRQLGDVDGRAVDRIYFAPRGFFQVVRRNLWGKNRSVSFFSRVSLRPSDPGVDSTDPQDTGGYGFNEFRLVGTFREPRLIDTPGDFQLTAFVEQAVRSSFNFRRRGVRMEYGRRFGNALTLSGRYAFDKTSLFDTKIKEEDQLLIDRRFPQVRLSTITGTVLRDTRDDILDPSRGTLLGLDATVAARSLGSEVGFAKTFVQAFAYRRLPGGTPLTLVAGARVGTAVGFARVLDDEVVSDVPASERFFAGGDTTVRGFVLDRLGTATTLNVQGFPSGGSGLVVVNGELRTGYWKGLGGVGFVDAGNVFRRAGNIRVGDLRPAAGFGVRYRSPLGPLRVDIGFNLDRQILPTGLRERRSV
ncbi:MAG: BamA/TamA family outer membrane protein, partial [Acidobacteria bacterium]|nr:BamA/TamA family outer membrane protein [Acidobacteriota bacterium]